MHTGDSKEIVSMHIPGMHIKVISIYRTVDWKQVPSSAVLVAF